MQVHEEIFGMWNNQEVPVITLTNSKDVSIKAIPYGAHLIEWSVPDKNGNFDNITLGLDDLEEYTEVRPYYGATVGRVAGRINSGMFTLDGVEYKLEQNLNGHHLHGGLEGLDTKLWDYKVTQSEEEASIIFSYEDRDGENGYPGTLSIEVTYTLTEQNEWKIAYRATTDAPTLFNPTNHVYFNLHGDATRTIMDHSLYVNADQFVELGEGTIPSGNVLPVDETPFDFREAAPVQQTIDSDHPQTQLVNGLDHPFVLNQDDKGPDAIILDQESGRTIKMWTDQPVVVIYTHNGPQAGVTIDGNEVGAYAGITLETQGYPDAINIPNFGNIILRPGEEFRSETIYQFHLNEAI